MLLKWMEHISADILKLIGWTKIYDVLLDLVTCMWYCFKHEIRIEQILRNYMYNDFSDIVIIIW